MLWHVEQQNHLVPYIFWCHYASAVSNSSSMFSQSSSCFPTGWQTLHSKVFRHINSNNYINITVLWIQFLSVVDQQTLVMTNRGNYTDLFLKHQAVFKMMTNSDTHQPFPCGIYHGVLSWCKDDFSAISLLIFQWILLIRELILFRIFSKLAFPACSSLNIAYAGTLQENGIIIDSFAKPTTIF